MQTESKGIGTPRLGTVALGVTFALFPLLLYLPFSIYLANTGQFSIQLKNLALIFIPAFVLSAAVGLACLAIFRATLRGHLVALVFAIGLAFWLQGSLLVWEYDVFDGREIDWAKNTMNGVFDSAVWLLLLGFALAVPQLFIRLCRPAAIVLLSLQSVLLLFAIVADLSVENDSSARNFSLDVSQKYHFSQNTNVILVILDAYQSDVFLEIISDDPTYASPFDGFTYFRDAVAGSNFTELAVPALLTGEIYDNSRPREQYLEEVYLRRSVMSVLKREGYLVEIFPWSGWGNESIYFDEGVATNLKKLDGRQSAGPTLSERNAKEALHLLDLSIFRAAPHFLKKFVHNDNQWFVSYIAAFLVPDSAKQVVSSDHKFTIGAMMQSMPESLPVDRNAPVFKFYHLSGVHSPLSVDEELRFVDRVFPFNRANYVRQAKANLRELGEFFAKLDEAGIYDKSMLVVVGDHGSGESAEMYLEPTDAPRTPYPLSGTNRNFLKDKARALPLVLIKPIDSRGALITSDSPVSLLNLPDTIFSELGIGTDTQNNSMFQIVDPERILRYHSAFEFGQNKSDYVGAITVYEINGDSWLNESWSVREIRRAGSSDQVE